LNYKQYHKMAEFISPLLQQSKVVKNHCGISDIQLPGTIHGRLHTCGYEVNASLSWNMLPHHLALQSTRSWLMPLFVCCFSCSFLCIFDMSMDTSMFSTFIMNLASVLQADRLINYLSAFVNMLVSIASACVIFGRRSNLTLESRAVQCVGLKIQ
ncbi:hypothetical protein Tsp_01204, partial [Trichinella spiralis]|uniref:hypothetical protein n=1 Tax=Trichinella spiralis TaxID=6334 RepID=UPI0001EFC868